MTQTRRDGNNDRDVHARTLKARSLHKGDRMNNGIFASLQINIRLFMRARDVN